MDANSLLSAVAVTVALVSGGGLGLQRQRVSGLRGDVVDLQNRVEARDARIAELEKKDIDKDGQLQRLRSDLVHAEKLATGEAHWVALGEQLDAHHTESMAALRSIGASLDKDKP